MELDHYLTAILHRWYLVVLLALVGALGAYGYFRWNDKTTVSTTVAVWEPAVVRGSTAQQAQISFAPIVQSRVVAERVVKKLGLTMSPDAVQGEVSVTLAKSLVPTVVTPLYVISVDDRDPNRAGQILTAVVDEGRQVFAELNSLDENQVDAAFAPDQARLQKQLDQAQDALRRFEASNNAYDLPAAIASQTTLVSSLRQGDRSSRSGTAGASLAAEQRNLSDAQHRLDQLLALKPDYDRLSFNVQLASTAVQQLAAQQNSASSPATAAVQAQVDKSKTNLNAAFSALAAFQKANGVSDLTSEIATQTTLVNNLLQLKQQLALAKGSTATQVQVSAARMAVDQAKNNAFAAQASRDGVCGNAQNPKYQCDAANAQVDAANTGVQQAQLGLQAASNNASPDQVNANVDKALATSQAELDRLRKLLPEYERLTIDVSLATGIVTQSLSRDTDLALQPSPGALEAQASAAQNRLSQSRGELAAFEKANGIADLPNDIASQRDLVNDLHREVLASQVSAAGRDQAIATEQAELNRLTALQPRFDQLSRQVTNVQNEMTQLQASRISLIVGNTVLPDAEVKVLDSPRIKPNTFWEVVLYTLSTMFGAFVGLVLVYLVAYFDQTPRNVDDVEALVGAPVLVRLPKAG